MGTGESTRQYPGRDLEAMAFAGNYHCWIVNEFSPYLSGSVAEVGAGSGTVSRLLLDAGVAHLYAFEPSANLYPLLTQALSDEPRASLVNDFFHATAGGKFDAVVYLNVLEHIEDDARELATAFGALNRGGHLLLFVPALGWLYSEHDREIGHFRRYSMRALVSLAIGAGFTVVKARYFDVAGILPWYVTFVMFRNTIGSRSVSSTTISSCR